VIKNTSVPETDYAEAKRLLEAALLGADIKGKNYFSDIPVISEKLIPWKK
jgi:hypothetical protein